MIRKKAPTPTAEPCRWNTQAQGWANLGARSELSVRGSLTGLTPLGAPGGWELANGPHTGRSPLSAQSLPFSRRLCWAARSPLPQGHILTLKGEGRPMGECQHVNEPERKTGQERGRGAWQLQSANERWGRNAGKGGVQACHLQHLGRALSLATFSSLAQQ